VQFVTAQHITRINRHLFLLNFCLFVFHCPETTALSKAFISYIIQLYWVVSFVVVRHHRLGYDYWAAILYRLGFIALSRFGGAHSVETYDAFWG